jgi:hypothetical protein
MAASIAILGLIMYNLSQSKDWRKLRWDQFWSLLTHAPRSDAGDW